MSVPQSALRSIWERHRASILAQVDVVERAVAALREGMLDESLRLEATRESHKLAGSLGTFGFAGASDCARELERVLGADPVPANCADPLAELVGALRAELEDTAGDADAPATEPAEPAERGDAPLVLLVEDDLTLAERLAAEASGRGLRVELADSPEKGRALAARERPDLVLLDLTFSDGTGEAYRLLSDLTAGSPPVPVLVLTVRDVFTDRVEVARRGGRGFVAKSLAPQQVIDQVVQLIERAAASETTLLAVDDDPAMLELIRTLLEPEGLRVTTLSDPRQFWQELERVRPDLLMLDIDMPHVNGIELCRVVRNDPRWASLPVLFLTSRRDEGTVRDVFTAGADDYLIKPVIGEELVVRIRNRLDRFHLHRFLTDRDALTGVLNRRSSTQGLERLLRLSRRYEQPLTLAAIDLDHFKQVNDVRGHAAGDAVLRRFGELLSHAFRGEDVVGRWGGEEFVIGMYGMAREDAVRRLRALLGTLAEEQFRGKDEQMFRIGFSAGVAQHPGDGDEVADLYRAADAAMYAAKAAGRGRVMVAGEVATGTGGQPDVVVVEDDDVLAELVVHELERRGHRSRRCSDGTQAVAALAGAEPTLTPRVVVLDIDLPGIDGVSVLRRLRADGALAGLRVIMLTARSAEADLLESLELGAYDHLTKPFSVPVLMHKVAQAMQTAGARS